MKKDNCMHTVPVYNEDGTEIIGARWFPLLTSAKKFAKNQCLQHGHMSWTMMSYGRDEVARLLTEHAPLASYWRPSSKRQPTG